LLSSTRRALQDSSTVRAIFRTTRPDEVKQIISHEQISNATEHIDDLRDIQLLEVSEATIVNPTTTTREATFPIDLDELENITSTKDTEKSFPILGLAIIGTCCICSIAALIIFRKQGKITDDFKVMETLWENDVNTAALHCEGMAPSFEEVEGAPQETTKRFVDRV